ncbi:unnamed protein product [Dibothriocephalus latus]|uniref:ENTH domain-containing protein n=1 Tax=Dibothriocephalus latus TaxID=60516 RepID=A0A3P7LMM0_DIBLA|nr:unnamed protein product [Dibothriocephalus latus]
MQSWTRALDAKAAFIDFCNVFDSVLNQRLIEKLKVMGIRGKLLTFKKRSCLLDPLGAIANMAGKMAKQLAGSGTGQSLMDRVTQAKYSLAGSSLGKVVAKASTVELIPPKKKHLDRLIRYSNEPSVSIPLLVGFLVERTHEKSWVIVFKALITSHHLMNYGNELIKEPQLDNTERSKRLMKGKRLSIMEITLATEKDLNNQIINAAFLLLYKDLIRLFASYNEGMMNLIGKSLYKLCVKHLYVVNIMQPKFKHSAGTLHHCRIALDLYSNFPEVMDKVDSFLTVAEVRLFFSFEDFNFT